MSSLPPRICPTPRGTLQGISRIRHFWLALDSHLCKLGAAVQHVPGPGDTRMAAGCNSRICSTVLSSFLKTRGSHPRSPKYCSSHFY